MLLSVSKTIWIKSMKLCLVIILQVYQIFSRQLKPRYIIHNIKYTQKLMKIRWKSNYIFDFLWKRNASKFWIMWTICKSICISSCNNNHNVFVCKTWVLIIFFSSQVLTLRNTVSIFLAIPLSYTLTIDTETNVDRFDLCKEEICCDNLL